MTTIATTSKIPSLTLEKAKSWSDVFKAVREADKAEAAMTTVEAPAAAPLVLTGPEVKALAAFGKQAAALVVPGTRRMMTVPELTAVNEFLSTSKVVAKVAKRAVDETLRPALMNHFDLAAEKAGLVTEETKRDKDGYYVLTDVVSAKVEGEKTYATRTAKEGSVTLSEPRLKELVAEGKLTHKQYLEATTAVRIIDEDAVLRMAQKDPALVAVFAEATTTTTPSVALTIK